MKSQSHVSFAISFIIAIALLGAGCAISDAPTPTSGTASSSTPTATTTPTPLTPSAPSTSGIPSNTISSTISASSTLDTTGWQEYQNKTLKFSFKYPLRGAYAPEFSVRLLPLSSAEIVNNCVPANVFQNAIERHVNVNGTVFCRTNTLEDTLISEDRWVTKTDKWYAVISFAKRHPTNRVFDFAAYNRQLEAIMSTFLFTTNPT